MRNPQELLDPQRAPEAQPTVLVGAMGGVVALLRAETGALAWRRKAAQPWLALAHGGDIVFVSSWSGQPSRPPALLRREEADNPHRRQRVVEMEPARVAARRASDGALLWQKSDWGLVALAQMAPQGDKVLVTSRHMAGDHTLYALDAQTGAALWRWRTPASPGELLRLWRRRVPEVVAAGAHQAGAYVAYNFASARRERNPWQIVSMVRREITVGLWRRPHVVEVARLTGGLGAVYLGTRLGLFALDAKQGRLLWYALPNTDLSNFDPAIAPNHAS